MKKAVTFLLGSVALMGAQAASATAAYVAPKAPWVFDGSGTFGMLTCDVALILSGPDDSADTTVSFDHSDVANLSADITLSGGLLGLCAAQSFSTVPAGDVRYASSGPMSGTLTLDNVAMTGVMTCTDNIVGTWNETAQTLAISSSLCGVGAMLTLVSPSPGDMIDTVDPNHRTDHHQ